MLNSEMLNKSNWNKVLCWPKEGEKLDAHCKKWDQDVEDVIDEVGIQCFLIYNCDGDKDIASGFAEEILCESYDWEVCVDDLDEDDYVEFKNFDIFCKRNGKWNGFDLDLINLIY